MSRIKMCGRCCACNSKIRTHCGMCGWELAREHSLELELSLMEEADPKLKEQAAKVEQAAKDLGLTGQES